MESQEVAQEKEYKKNRICRHIRMEVVEDLQAETVTEKVKEMADKKAELISDDFSSHAGLDEAVTKVIKQEIKLKDGHKVLPWVHRKYYYNMTSSAISSIDANSTTECSTVCLSLP